MKKWEKGSVVNWVGGTLVLVAIAAAVGLTVYSSVVKRNLTSSEASSFGVLMVIEGQLPSQLENCSGWVLPGRNFVPAARCGLVKNKADGRIYNVFMGTNRVEGMLGKNVKISGRILQEDSRPSPNLPVKVYAFKVELTS